MRRKVEISPDPDTELFTRIRQSNADLDTEIWLHVTMQ